MATQRNFTAEEVKKKMQQMPAEIRSLLYSPEMVAAIQKVGEKNKLHYDQMGALEVETSNVMLGFTDTADYPEMLMQSLLVDKTQAETIAKDINDALFAKIRESMKASAQKTATPTESGKSVVMPSSVAKVGAEAAVAKPAVSVAVNPVTTPAPVSISPAAPVVPPATPKPISTGSITIPSAPAKPAMPAALPKVDAMLSKPTVSIAPQQPAAATPTAPNAAPANNPAPAPQAKAEPPKPGPLYKTDPYREPVE